MNFSKSTDLLAILVALLKRLFFFQAVEGFMELYTPMTPDQKLMLRFRECHLLVLKGLQQDQRAFGPQWTKQITR